MIAIVDYGVGNLFSLRSSLRYLGLGAEVTADADALRRAERIILPGVGAFADARARLDDSGLTALLLEEAEKKPFLGICLGMQLLFDRSFEYGEHPGLGLIGGEVAPLKDDLADQSCTVPHMGWNSLRPQLLCPPLRREHPGRVAVWRRGCHRCGAPGERVGHPVPPGKVRGHGAPHFKGIRGAVRREQHADFSRH